jgi:hypothetical protein
MRHWKKLILLVLLLLLLGGAWFGYCGYRFATVEAPHAYAVEWVAGMTIEFMERNDGAWPKNWDDLREPYESAVNQVGKSWTFEQLKDWVEVDFTAQPSVLVLAKLNGDQPPFRVIWRRDGKSGHWEGGEPNIMILKYLQKRANRTSSSKPDN